VQIRFSGSGELLLGIGRGRVYNGTTTWWAAEILETVTKLHGVDPSRIAPADYSQLAEILYELELRRFPTPEAPRLRDYERTERVIQQLQATLGPAAGSPATAAVVQDIIRYYPSITRMHGEEWSVHVGASGYWRHGEQETQREYEERWYRDFKADSTLWYHGQGHEDRTSDDEESEFSPTVRLGYGRYRPLSLKWQFNTSVELSVTWKDFYSRSRFERDHRIQDFLRDTTWVFESSSSRKQYLPAHRNAYYGLAALMEVYYIPSSRVWWSFTAESRLRTGYRTQGFGYSVAGQMVEPPDAIHLTVLDSELAYHRQVTWGLYLDAKLAFSVPSITLWIEDGATDLERWSALLRGSVSLSYYF
jgi:hypothetical protein